MKIVRNILGLVLGLLIGGALNASLVMMSSSIIPLPEGINPMDMNSLIENMPNFEPKHFIVPFLAHALGTFIGALIAATIAATHKLKWALTVGVFFLLGGITVAIDLPAPMWFNIVDLALAYIPMGIIGGKIGMKINKN